jgi:hypothetical protein
MDDRHCERSNTRLATASNSRSTAVIAGPGVVRAVRSVEGVQGTGPSGLGWQTSNLTSKRWSFSGN